jgi:serine protease SohB
MTTVAEIATNYTIFFAIFAAFCMVIMIMIFCCVACYGNDDKKIEKNTYFKKRFDLIKYSEIYESDRVNMVTMIRESNKQDMAFGIDKKIASNIKTKETKHSKCKKFFGCFSGCLKSPVNTNVILRRSRSQGSGSQGSGSQGSGSQQSLDNNNNENHWYQFGMTSNKNQLRQLSTSLLDINAPDQSTDPGSGAPETPVTLTGPLVPETIGTGPGVPETPMTLTGSGTPGTLDQAQDQTIKEINYTMDTKTTSEEKKQIDVQMDGESLESNALIPIPKEDILLPGKELPNDHTTNPMITTLHNNAMDQHVIKQESKVYLHYSFDNMNNDGDDNSTSTVLGNITDDTKNVFRDLEAFVNIVLKTMDPMETVILLKISSPGGHAYKFELAYTHLMRLRHAGFTLIALIDDICASGGFMLATACNRILCSKFAIVGSIGVVASMYNYHALSQKIGVVEKTITTGPYKRPFPTAEPIEQEHIDRVVESINEALKVFRDIVQESRKLSDEEMKDILSAKVWYGEMALKKKLVDRIISSNAYLDQLIDTGNHVWLVCRRRTESKSTLLQSLLKLSSSALPVMANMSLDVMIKILKQSYNKTFNRPHEQNLYYEYMNNLV